MQKEFLKYLTDTCRCSADQKYLLAVSGGVDSVVMAHLFRMAGTDSAIAHCNFHLRGSESDDDRTFVEKLADRFEWKCFVKDFDTLSYASGKGISIQMAARDLRYAWFDELAGLHGYQFIAVGHNQNDIVETFLLNFSRGSGIRGLSGISPRHGRIIRPLLFASRAMILSYAKEKSIQWREDSSNAETRYQRNKIRHTIIPAFETLNPVFLQHAMETIELLSHTGQLLDQYIGRIRQDLAG